MLHQCFVSRFGQCQHGGFIEAGRLKDGRARVKVSVPSASLWSFQRYFVPAGIKPLIALK